MHLEPGHLCSSMCPKTDSYFLCHCGHHTVSTRCCHLTSSLGDFRLSWFAWSDFSWEVLVAPRRTPLIQQLHCYLEMLRSAVEMRRRKPQTYVCLPRLLRAFIFHCLGKGFVYEFSLMTLTPAGLLHLLLWLQIGSHLCCDLVTMGTI